MNQILHNSLNSHNSPNLLIYPGQGHDIFYKSFHEIYKITHSKNIQMGEITYTKNNHYYEFDFKRIINRNINDLIGILKEIIISKDFYTHTGSKIILFKNFDRVKITIQNILRVIIEKYRETSVFICLTDKYTSVIEPLKSRFLCLRFSDDTNREKRKIIYNKDKKLKTPKYYDFIYSLKRDNIIKVIDKEKEIEKYTDIYDLICSQILQIYKKEKINKNDYIKLREFAYNILKNNIDINIFYRSMLDYLLNMKTIRDKNKCKIIRLFSDSEYDLIRSYRKIVILESLLLNIYYVLRDDHPLYLL